jgi:hypothetical protein
MSHLGGHAMPMHDWTRLDYGIYHAFHMYWIGSINRAVNKLLPKHCYAMPEQQADSVIPDVLALHTLGGDFATPLDESSGGGVAVAVEDFVVTMRPITKHRRIVIHHKSNDRVVSIIEVVSHSNKATIRKQNEFCLKCQQIIQSGVHLLYIDPFPPPPRGKYSFHNVLWPRLGGKRHDLGSPPPLSTGSYEACERTRCYVNPFRVGEPIPTMPVFIEIGRSIALPIEETYLVAYEDVLPMHRKILEA